MELGERFTNLQVSMEQVTPEDTKYNHSRPTFTKPRRAMEALLYSNVFISFCALGLTIETYLLAGERVSLPLVWFVFLSTLFTYNLSSVQRVLRGIKQVKPRQQQSWGQRHIKELAILGLASIAGAAGLYLYFNLQLNLWLVGHLALISIGYTVPVVYKARKVRPLRSVPLLKVFLIAYVWAVVTALFPLMDAGLEVWDEMSLLLGLRRFLFILALALLFDIRDYTYDRHTNTLTFPGLMGVQRTKLMSLGLMLVYGCLVSVTETGLTQFGLLAGAAVAAGVVVYASDKKPRLYYAVLADGAMLIHFAFVYLAKSW
jgi:4-hydroxybenzoate polyprenyltransferase